MTAVMADEIFSILRSLSCYHVHIGGGDQTPVKVQQCRIPGDPFQDETGDRIKRIPAQHQKIMNCPSVNLPKGILIFRSASADRLHGFMHLVYLFL